METIPLILHNTALNSEDFGGLQSNIGELGQKLFTQLLEITSYDTNFEAVLYWCKERGKPFTSESFPPSQSSLYCPLTAAKSA